MAAELFVDTSAWYPLADRSHADHERLARSLREQVAEGVRVVTTDLVLAESHALIMRSIHRRAALEFVTQVRRPPNEVVHSTPDLLVRAERDWLSIYQDQDFSLADAVSFAVMKERGIERALGLDGHFGTAGFELVT